MSARIGVIGALLRVDLLMMVIFLLIFSGNWDCQTGSQSDRIELNVERRYTILTSIEPLVLINYVRLRKLNIQNIKNTTTL